MPSARAASDDGHESSLLGSRCQSRLSARRTQEQWSTWGDAPRDCILAVMPHRAPTGVEAGVAAINLLAGRLALTQIRDDASYSRILQQVSLHPAAALLIPDPFFASESIAQYETLNDRLHELTGLTLEPSSRQNWTSEAGLAFVKTLGTPGEGQASMLLAVMDQSLALGAAAALFRWLNVRRDIIFTPGSLDISYQASKGSLFVDMATARNLEIVINNSTGTSHGTLYELLNTCRTHMGSRLLRSLLLQPSNDRNVIEARLDAVQELTQDLSKLNAIDSALRNTLRGDLDHILTRFIQTSQKRADHGGTERRIADLFRVSAYLTAMPQMSGALRSSKCPLLTEANHCLSDLRLERIRSSIDDGLSHPSNSVRGEQAKLARLYAVKQGQNKLLDVARETFTENQKDIQESVRRANQMYDIKCSVRWTESGYRYVIGIDDMKGPAHSDWREVEQDRTIITFTTQELQNSARRLEQAETEVYNFSDQFISHLANGILRHIGVLRKCAEAVAQLDVLVSLAEYAIPNNRVRPEFRGYLAIRRGCNPVLQNRLGEDACIANDSYAAEGVATLHVIHGPNMSGKTTYLRQIGLLLIQATIGCFVPADYACFRLHDALLSRLSHDDSLERSLSTFASEMATVAMILGTATKDSMVLIDELGRGTAPLDGVGMAHAVAEALARRHTFTFFVSHFGELRKTLSFSSGVAFLHLEGENRNEQGIPGMSPNSYRFRVADGPAAQLTHYGIELAEKASLPRSVISQAHEVAQILSDLEDRARTNSAEQALALRRSVLLELRKRLRQIATLSSLPDDELAISLRQIQRQALVSLRKTMQVDPHTGG